MNVMIIIQAFSLMQPSGIIAMDWWICRG